MRFQGDKAVTRPAGNPGSNAKKLHRQVRGFDGTLGTSNVSPDHISRSSIVVVWNRDCSYPYLVETALGTSSVMLYTHKHTHTHKCLKNSVGREPSRKRAHEGTSVPTRLLVTEAT